MLIPPTVPKCLSFILLFVKPDRNIILHHGHFAEHAKVLLSRIIQLLEKGTYVPLQAMYEKIVFPMNEITVETWEEYQQKINDLRRETDKILKSNCPNDWETLQKEGFPQNDFLYRGQGSSNWGLNSTLELHTQKDSYRVIDYLKKIECVWSKFKLKFPNEMPHGQVDSNELGQELLRRAKNQAVFNLPEEKYQIMATLRHFGFPSPLLDWTREPDIAAFFAFSDSVEGNQVSIFVYSEMPLGINTSTIDGPYILSSRGPEAPIPRPNVRHSNQQGEHTLCIKKNKHDFYFCSHDNLPDIGNGHSNLLWKFNIPKNQKSKVLGQLRQKGCRKSFLFHSPDDLVEELTDDFFPKPGV